jgi:hypothetical protein
VAEVMPLAQRQPARLLALYRDLSRSPERLRRTPPTLAFAVIAQARLGGLMGPEQEARALANLLSYWALWSNLNTSEICSARSRIPVPAPAT